MPEDTFVTNSEGILVDKNGKALTTFVDSFILKELNSKEATVILLRLYEKGTIHPGKVVSAREANQVRMSPRVARRLGSLLNQAADIAEGVGEPRQ